MGGVVSRGNGRRWRIWYIDRHGKRRWGTGHADKRASQKLADELEQEERRIREGLVDPKARERRAAASADVAVLLGLWREYMVAKGDGAKHANHQATAARRVLESAGVVSIAAIDSDAINGAIGRMTVIIKKKVQPASARTRNHALGSVKAFCRWLEQTDRLSEFPRGLKALKPRSVEADRRRERRALTPEELDRLISTTETGPGVALTTRPAETCRKPELSGPERAMLYRLACGTGFRANELRSLTRDSFDLDDPTNAYVTVSGAYSKRKRTDRQPIRSDLARAIAAWLAQHGSPPRVPQRTAAILRDDLKRAGIPIESRGKVLDFHSFRQTYITHIVKRGTDPATAQQLARHSDVRLTLQTYTDVTDDQKRKALGEE